MRWAGAGLACWLFCHLAPAAAWASPPPLIAIVIDDLGDQWDSGRRTVDLPYPITCSFLPRTPHASRLAAMAHESGKEVMLHLPMESMAGHRTGPGALTLDMSRSELVRTLAADLASVPHARGINNHMGSLLTRHPGHMGWLMAELASREGLFFLDSRTTHHTVAQRIAGEHGLPATSRDIFLDYTRDSGIIRRQFLHLLSIARKHGTALAIGHPYPETLSVLEELLPPAVESGIRLVPVSELIDVQQGRPELWQASLSPSPTGAKNSKPSPLSTCCEGPVLTWSPQP